MSHTSANCAIRCRDWFAPKQKTDWQIWAKVMKLRNGRNKRYYIYIYIYNLKYIEKNVFINNYYEDLCLNNCNNLKYTGILIQTTRKYVSWKCTVLHKKSLDFHSKHYWSYKKTVLELAETVFNSAYESLCKQRKILSFSWITSDIWLSLSNVN